MDGPAGMGEVKKHCPARFYSQNKLSGTDKQVRLPFFSIRILAYHDSANPSQKNTHKPTHMPDVTLSAKDRQTNTYLI
jgi:hypothetical protein